MKTRITEENYSPFVDEYKANMLTEEEILLGESVTDKEFIERYLVDVKK